MGTVSQAVALMHEEVRSKVYELFQTDDTLYSLLEERTDDNTVSYRPYRSPSIILGAAQFQQNTLNGDSLGTGIAPTTDVFTAVPIVFTQAGQYTKLTELTTKNDRQAVENYVTKTMKLAMEQFRERIEAAINLDSSGTLDTVVAVAGAVITVNNANMFADGQKVDIWSGLGGVFRGTVTVYSTDPNNKQIILTANPPGATTAGDLLLIRGSAGVTGTSVNGVRSLQVNGNIGAFMNVPRSSYPGRLSTPTVNLQSQPLTPAAARRTIAAIQRALGIKAPSKEKLIYHMGLDQIAAWENVGITITQNIYQQMKGDTSEDMLKKDYPATFAGRPTKISLHATAGRIDGLCLEHWYRIEFQKPDYYDAAGQRIFPQYDIQTGGLMTNLLFYLIIGINIGNDNPLAGVYLQNAPIPAGY